MSRKIQIFLMIFRLLKNFFRIIWFIAHPISYKSSITYDYGSLFYCHFVYPLLHRSIFTPRLFRQQPQIPLQYQTAEIFFHGCPSPSTPIAVRELCKVAFKRSYHMDRNLMGCHFCKSRFLLVSQQDRCLKLECIEHAIGKA